MFTSSFFHQSHSKSGLFLCSPLHSFISPIQSQVCFCVLLFILSSVPFKVRSVSVFTSSFFHQSHSKSGLFLCSPLHSFISPIQSQVCFCVLLFILSSVPFKVRSVSVFTSSFFHQSHSKSGLFLCSPLHSFISPIQSQVCFCVHLFILSSVPFKVRSVSVFTSSFFHQSHSKSGLFLCSPLHSFISPIQSQVCFCVLLFILSSVPFKVRSVSVFTSSFFHQSHSKSGLFLCSPLHSFISPIQSQVCFCVHLFILSSVPFKVGSVSVFTVSFPCHSTLKVTSVSVSLSFL